MATANVKFTLLLVGYLFLAVWLAPKAYHFGLCNMVLSGGLEQCEVPKPKSLSPKWEGLGDTILVFAGSSTINYSIQ